MERIPIFKMSEFLLVTIQVDMHDRLAITLQDDLTEMIVRTRARGVLIDISSLDVVDSFIGRILGNIASISGLLDTETVVVGMQPAVAITLVELGLSLPGVRTALSVEKGMALLHQALKQTEVSNDFSGVGASRRALRTPAPGRAPTPDAASKQEPHDGRGPI